MATALPITNETQKDKCFINKFLDKVHDFFDNENYVDVTFLWRSNGKRVTAHRLILAASSAFFDELFQTPRGIAPAIYIEDVAPESFQLLVTYCYTGLIFPESHNAFELLNAATILKLEGAVEICRSYIDGDKKEPQSALASQSAITIGSNTNTDLSNLADCSASSTSTRSNQVANTLLVMQEFSVTISYDFPQRKTAIYRWDESENKWLLYTKKYYLSIFSYPIVSYWRKRLIFVENSRVAEFNFLTETFHELTPLRRQTNAACIAHLNGIIYFMGGCKNNKSLRTAEKLDLDKRESWISLPEMETARRYATAVVVDDLIYVIGGEGINIYEKTLKSVECFNTQTSTWSKCADMPDAQFLLGATGLNGFLYGVSSDDAYIPNHNLYCYDPRKNTWTKLAPINVPRGRICVTTFCGQVWAIGGEQSSLVEVYDRERNVWMTKRSLPTKALCKSVVVPTEELDEIEQAISMANE